VVLAGARDSGRGKLLAGITRAAFRCDAAIIDSGVRTGIEQYCLRRNINLVGVFPESEVSMPKINPS
jgi:SLOG in TRPM, prokaryote